MRARGALTIALVMALISILATAVLPGALASSSQAPVLQGPEPSADNRAEESGSLEFVVSSVIGRALNVPGTY